MKTIFTLILTTLLLSCSSKKDAVNFEKIVFHTSPCFGNCPIINMQVSKDKSVLLSRIENSRTPKVAASENTAGLPQYEYFKGNVSNKLYNELLTELAKTDTVKFNGPNCCDAPMKSIIAYYNGKRRHIETMFPPKEAEKLIEILYQISKTEGLVKTTDRFEIEVDTNKVKF